jgi:DNA topoisomerase-1
MEEQLDEIEKGKATTQETLGDFYKTFKKDSEARAKEMPNFKEGQPTGRPCDKCGQGEMVEKAGKFGIFLACSRYPDATTRRSSSRRSARPRSSTRRCENCGKPMVVKRGRFGMFLACTGYPECKTTRKIIATKQGDERPSRIRFSRRSARTAARTSSIKQGRFGEFTACTGYPECKYVKLKSHGVVCPEGRRRRRRAQVDAAARSSTAARTTRSATSRCGTSPILEPCPQVRRPFLTEEITKRHGRQSNC